MAQGQDVSLIDRYYNEREFVDEDLRELLAVPPPTRGDVEIIFLTHYRLHSAGARLGITGTSETLGEWVQPKTMTQCFNGWWAVRVYLPPKSKQEAKLVVHVPSDPREILYWELEGRMHRLLAIDSAAVVLLPWDEDEFFTVPLANKANKRKRKLRKPRETCPQDEIEIDWSALEESASCSRLSKRWRVLLCVIVPTALISGVALYLGKAKISAANIP